MNSERNTGRLIGILLFLQLAGLIVPFVMLLPLAGGPQAYLANASGASPQIKLAVVLLLANCALTMGISIAAFRSFRERSEPMALWLLAASVIMFVLQAVDNVHALAMLSLSQRHAEPGAPAEAFQALAAAAGSTRRWAHLTELLSIDAWIGLFYGILYRFAVVPRPLAAFGLITVALHFSGITLRMYLGQNPVTLMGASIAASHVALASWLVARGFAGRRMRASSGA